MFSTCNWFKMLSTCCQFIGKWVHEKPNVQIDIETKLLVSHLFPKVPLLECQALRMGKTNENYKKT